MNRHLCTIVIVLLIPTLIVADNKCRSTEMENEYDSDLAKLMGVGVHGRKWPENLKQNTAFCV